MLQIVVIFAIVLWAQRTVIGVKTVYTNEPEPREFDDLDDVMEYAELRKTGWRGGINEYYKWKGEK